jgi:tetratricopeptide (TPR) repeat protein
VQLLSGDLAAALEHARRGVELADRSGEAFHRSGKRSTLADVLHSAGQFTQARALFAESASIRDDATAEPMPMFARYRWCDLLLTLEEYEQAAAVSREALSDSLAGDHPLDIALHRMNLGLALLRTARSGSGETIEARTLIDEALVGLRDAGNLDLLPRGLLACAECLGEESLSRALEYVDEALAITRRCVMPLHEIDARLGRAAVLARAGRTAEAARTAAAAAADAARLGYRRRDAALAALGPGDR